MNIQERDKLNRRKGYMQAVLDMACMQLGEPTPSLKFKSSLKTTAGRAYTVFSPTMKDSYIELNERMLLLNSVSDMRNTVLHELAHIYANRITGTRCGHNEYWRTCMSIISGVDKDKVERCHNMTTPTPKKKVSVIGTLDLG
jgi:predicted SprT family Zn-dependent metalloprotease